MTETTRRAGVSDAEVRKANNDEWRLDSLIAVRAKQVKGDKPPPDRQRARDALRSARTRQAAGWHRAQAERHRATLTDLIACHEAAADRLAGGGGR